MPRAPQHRTDFEEAKRVSADRPIMLVFETAAGRLYVAVRWSGRAWTTEQGKVIRRMPTAWFAV